MTRPHSKTIAILRTLRFAPVVGEGAINRFARMADPGGRFLWHAHSWIISQRQAGWIETRTDDGRQNRRVGPRSHIVYVGLTPAARRMLQADELQHRTDALA